MPPGGNTRGKVGRCWLSAGQQDARLYAYGANRSHGLRRTIEDKRKAVLGMLADFSDWSDNRIAKHVGVSHVTVGTHRSSLVNLTSEESAERKVITKHGTTATMNVSGQKAAAKAPAKEASQATAESNEVETVSAQESAGTAQSTPKVESDSTLTPVAATASVTACTGDDSSTHESRPPVWATSGRSSAHCTGTRRTSPLLARRGGHAR